MRPTTILLFALSFAFIAPSAWAQCAGYFTQSSCQMAGCTWASGYCQSTSSPIPPFGCTGPTTKVFTQGVAASFIATCGFGTAPISYNGPVPAGMTLSHITGYASGTPTTVKSATVYTIIASNAAGTQAMPITITVNAPLPAAPANLTYSANPAIYTKGTAITPNTPTVGGGPVASWSVSPALPAGLGLNSANGVISGTPTSVAAAANFTVTASNAGGSTARVVSITVNNPPAPANISYPVNPATYMKDYAISPNVPTVGGGPASSWTVLPALPAGLLLNAATGVISGKPTVVAPLAIYTVRASNVSGSAIKQIAIQVKTLNISVPLDKTATGTN